MNSQSIPTVSIVLTSYNAERYLSSTIESVIAQSYSDWRLLVIDDCSTDRTRDIVSKYVDNDTRIQLHVLEKNSGGPALPRNVGVRLAKTPWIAFLDADDIWHPKKLEKQMEALAESGCDFCCTEMKDFSDETKILFKDSISSTYHRLTFFKQLMKNRVPTSSVVAKRSIMIAFPFNEDPRYIAREDYECWLKIHEKIGETIKISSILVYYRILPGQISGSKVKMLRKNFMVLSEYKKSDGKGLGGMKYFYFISYFIQSIYLRVFKKVL